MTEIIVNVVVTGLIFYLALSVGHLSALVMVRRLLADMTLGIANIRYTEEDEPDEAKRAVLQSHNDTASQTTFMNMLLVEEIVEKRHPFLHRLITTQWKKEHG